MFDYLPLAGVINNKIFCVHSGIGQYARFVDDINNIKRPIKLFTKSEQENNIVADLLFCSPDGNTSNELYTGNNISSNYRSREFTEDMTMDFLKFNNLDLIIRSHDVIQKGFEKLHNSRVVSIFSSTNYGSTHNNNAGIISFKKNLEIQPKIIHYEDCKSVWFNPDNSKMPLTPKKTFR